jgi:hypothetical protein
MKRRSFGTVRTAALAALVLVVAGCSQMPELPFGLGGGSWTSLIDGEKGLENFNRVGDANWRGEDGAIVADKGKAGFLVTKDSYRDFQLRAEFWADHTTNSGIFMRCADRNKITDKSCYEANIFDQRPDPTYGTGGIVHIAKVAKPMKAGGRWNVYEITAKGPKLTVVLNGTRTAEVEHSQFPAGPIALQYGTLPPTGAPGGAIKWRKVQVRPL